MRITRLDALDMDAIVIKVMISNAELASMRYAPENILEEIKWRIRDLIDEARARG